MNGDQAYPLTVEGYWKRKLARATEQSNEDAMTILRLRSEVAALKERLGEEENGE